MGERISFEDAMKLRPAAATAPTRVTFEDALKMKSEQRYGDVGWKDYATTAITTLVPGAEALRKATGIGGKSQYTDDFRRTMAQGATFGWSDELAGRARQLIGLITGGETDYKKLRDEERAALKEFETAFPKTALTAEIAGGVVVPGGVGKTAATQTGRQLARTLTKQGVVLGGIQGLGSSDSEILDGEIGGAVKDTTKGAAIGGIVGRATPWVVEKAVQGANIVKEGVGRLVQSQRGAEKWSERELARALSEAGITTDADLQRAITAARRDSNGGPVTGLDLGNMETVRLAREALRNATGDRVRGIRPGEEMMADLERTQGRDRTGDVRDRIDNMVGSNPAARDAHELNRVQERLAGEEYRRIQDIIENTGLTAPEVRELLNRPDIADAWAGAARLMAGRGKHLTPQQREMIETVMAERQGPGAPVHTPVQATMMPPVPPGRSPDAPAPGLPNPSPTPPQPIQASVVTEGARPGPIPEQRDVAIPLEALDDMIKILSDQARGLRRAGEGHKATVVGGQKEAVDDAADIAITRAGGPDLMAARRQVRENRSDIEARELGMKAFKAESGAPVNELITEYRALPTERRNRFIEGYLQSLRESVEQIGDKGFRKADAFKSPEHQRLLDEIISTPGLSERVRDTLERMQVRNQRNRDLLSIARGRERDLSNGPLEDVTRGGAMLSLGSPVAALHSMRRALLDPVSPRRANAMTELLLSDVATPTGGRGFMRTAPEALPDRLSDALQHVRNPALRSKIITEMLLQAGIRSQME